MRRSLFWRLTAFALVALGGCSDLCGNKVVSRVDAPDGRHTAVMFQRDCGATTGFSTQISVLDVGEKVAGGGNAFSADGDHGAASTGDWGGPWAEMKWIDSNHLLVRFADKSRIFRQDGDIGGVKVSYQRAVR